jgi:ketosteroid isomerase-like protein
MSQENVEIIRAVIDAYNRADWDAALKDSAPDFELDWSRALGPQRGIYRLDQMGAFFDDFAETFESIRIEAHEFIDAGENVVVPLTGYFRARDGIEATTRITLLWAIRGDAVVRACMYQEQEEALKAAGLSE